MAVEHLDVRATDPTEAEDVVTGLYLPHRLELPARVADLDMHLSAFTFGDVVVGRLGYGRELRLVTAEADHFHVNVPLRGRARSRSGSTPSVVSDPHRAAVFAPGEPADIEWTEDCTQLCLMIGRAALETQLEHLLGRPLSVPLRFDVAMDLTSPLGRLWVETLRVVVQEMGRRSGGPSLLPLHHAERLLLDGLLLGQTHNHHDALVEPTPLPARGPVARAVELVQERPDSPWSTSTLAREVHLSARALQEGFKRDVGRPPMTYLRDVRLRRVRDELLRSAPGSTTVSLVASRWGIVHMGRFAGAYRTAFGESPRDTLARAPR